MVSNLLYAKKTIIVMHLFDNKNLGCAVQMIRVLLKKSWVRPCVELTRCSSSLLFIFFPLHFNIPLMAHIFIWHSCLFRKLFCSLHKGIMLQQHLLVKEIPMELPLEAFNITRSSAVRVICLSTHFSTVMNPGSETKSEIQIQVNCTSKPLSHLARPLLLFFCSTFR